MYVTEVATGMLERNWSNRMDGRPRASGAQMTMTIWQSRRRQSIALRYSSDSIRPRRRSRKTGWEWGISSRTMEWCFIGVGDAEGQRHDRIHCQKTKQIVAVHAIVWHCTATLRKSKRVSQHAFFKDASTASARTSAELILLSILPSKPLCFE